MKSLRDAGCPSLLHEGVEIVKLKLLNSIQLVNTEFPEIFHKKWFHLSVLKRTFPQMILSTDDTFIKTDTYFYINTPRVSKKPQSKSSFSYVCVKNHR